MPTAACTRSVSHGEDATRIAHHGRSKLGIDKSRKSVSMRTADDLLWVTHDNLPFPCGHDVELHSTAEWKGEFSIFINYNPGKTENSDICPANLEFSLDVVEAGLEVSPQRFRQRLFFVGGGRRR